MPDSMQDTLDHISKVQVRIAEIQTELDQRAALHDRSKLKEPEKSGYDALVTRLADIEYGSAEYRAALAEAKPTIEHHYAHNSHHPEHWSVPTSEEIAVLRHDIFIMEQLPDQTEGGLDIRVTDHLKRDLVAMESRVNGMSLLDVVEMLCDWKAASERTKQGSIAQSLAHNKERFGIDDQLYNILVNTVKELGW